MALRTQPRADAQNLDALFSLGGTEYENARGFRLVSPDLLIAEKQVRAAILDDDNMDGLRESIAETARNGGGIMGTGILQPIIVTPRDDGRYTVKAGHRRHFAAAQLAAMGKLSRVPVYVDETPVNPQSRVVEQLTENTQRLDLNPLELTAALRAMRDDWGWSWDDIRARLGYSEKTLKRYANLDTLQEDVKQLIKTRPDTVASAEAINKLPTEAERAPFLGRAAAGEGFRSIARDVEKRVIVLNEAAAVKAPTGPTPQERHDRVMKGMKRLASQIAEMRKPARAMRGEIRDLITIFGVIGDERKRDINREGRALIRQIEMLLEDADAVKVD